MICEMCGKKAELFRAVIEGTELSVCAGCANFGRTIKKIEPLLEKSIKKSKAKEPVLAKEEKIKATLLIVPDFARRIRDRREKFGLTQEELAKKLAEKESLLNKLESNKAAPSIALAEKLEKLLGIKLIEVSSGEDFKATGKQSSGTFTVGDFVKVRKRKG